LLANRKKGGKGSPSMITHKKKGGGGNLASHSYTPGRGGGGGGKKKGNSPPRGKRIFYPLWPGQGKKGEEKERNDVPTRKSRKKGRRRWTLRTPVLSLRGKKKGGRKERRGGGPSWAESPKKGASPLIGRFHGKRREGLPKQKKKQRFLPERKKEKKGGKRKGPMKVVDLIWKKEKGIRALSTLFSIGGKKEERKKGVSHFLLHRSDRKRRKKEEGKDARDF